MNTYLLVTKTIYYTKIFLKEITDNIDNIITFNMDENTIDEVLEEASYFSMFDEKKCIIVKNAKFFSTNKDTKKSAEEQNKLLKYLDNENKNTLLIFISDKIDNKKKICSLIKENNNLFIEPNMSKTDMKNELKNIVIKNNYKIDDNSLWYIINNSNSDFDICINELNKIFIYYNNPCYIKYDDVINIVCSNIIDNNFKLVESIINKDLNNSIKYLNDLEVLKVEPTIILSLIYREFKLMLSVIIYESNNINHNEILKSLKILDWQYDKIKNNIRLYSKKEIKDEIVYLSKLDYKLKSGLINKDNILIEYIMKICN